MGGGLGLEYNNLTNENREKPSPRDLINSIKGQVTEKRVKLILEPGRSIVGNTSVFVTKVVGIKKT